MKVTSMVLAAIAMLWLVGGCAHTHAVSIDGNYELVSRDLPDGKVQRPPQVMGWLTMDDGMRNFNVYWTNPDGKASSIAAASSYQMQDGTFTETNRYYMVNDATSSKGITYDLSNAVGTAQVWRTEGQIRFKLPLHDEPEVVFTHDGMTATRTGAFVDHWKRVGD